MWAGSDLKCLSPGMMVPALAWGAPAAAPPPTSAKKAKADREKTFSDVYLSVISQQTFIGCWKLNAELSSLLSISLDKLRKSAPVKVSFVYNFVAQATMVNVFIKP